MSRSKKRLLLRSLAVAIAVLVVLAAVYLILVKEEDNDHKTVTMNYREYDEDQDPMGFYRSVDPGDTLLIKDRAVNVASDHDDSEGSDVTYFWFESAHSGESIDQWYDENKGYKNYDMVFNGNLTHKYRAGDDVVITLHCTSYQVVGVTIEVIDEIMDDPSSDTLPASSIKKE